MVGKATLFIVAGFSLIFLVVEYNMGNVSTRAVSNFADYYVHNYAHEAAISGANIAASEIFFDPGYAKALSLDINGATVDVKVTVDNFKKTRKITAVAEYNGIEDTVEVVLSPSKFSKFAYYSESEGTSIWWMDKDTVWGPFHTQDKLKVSGKPTFFGKVSTLLGMEKYDKKTKPNFYGGYESGIDLPLPTNGLVDVGIEAAKGGKIIALQDTVYLTFVSDSIKVKYKYNAPETSYLASAFAPNGVIMTVDAVVRLKGKVKGDFTVASSKVFKGGDIYIDDDITYNTDPRTNPNSTDVLGIVAKNNVYVTENPANNNSINIDASIYCEAGGFGAQNYSSRPVSGTINLFGGIIQKTRAAVGTFSGSSVTAGFSKNYKYDERLLVTYPPAYPGTGGFEVVSWYE